MNPNLAQAQCKVWVEARQSMLSPPAACNMQPVTALICRLAQKLRGSLECCDAGAAEVLAAAPLC